MEKMRTGRKGFSTTHTVMHRIAGVASGWESLICELCDSPFKGRERHLSDGRVCCPKCFCDSSNFQKVPFVIRKVTGV